MKRLLSIFQILFQALLAKKIYLKIAQKKSFGPYAAVAVKFTCFGVQAFQIMNLQQKEAKQDKIEEPFSSQVWLRDSLLDN